MISGLLAAVLGRPALAPAHTLLHVVRPGESIERLAIDYYGEPKAIPCLIAANHLEEKRPLRPGQRLRIPTAWRYRLGKAETLEDVALRRTGDRRRAPFLAELSGRASPSDVRPGQEIVIPFHLSHQARGEESLGALAATFYGDSRKADLLAAYNFRSSHRLENGERIVIPIAHVWVLPGKRTYALGSAEKRADVKGRIAATRDRAAGDEGAAKEGIDEAKRLQRQGRFAEAAAKLMRLLAEEDATEEELVGIQRALVCSYVALGLDGLAVDAAREALARSPGLALDPAETSPKIRAAFERARGPAPPSHKAPGQGRRP
jgi:hypothetical protein